MPEIKEIIFPNPEAQIIFGKQDENLKFIETLTEVEFFGRGNQLKLKGEKENIENAVALLEKLKNHILHHKNIEKSDILKLSQNKKRENQKSKKENIGSEILINSKKNIIYPKSPKQRKYIETIRKYDLSFCIGPAGTGKTYIAVASAIESLKQGKYQRIILTRPAIEAGERLGFLPGDLEEKIKPYLQPIYDALFDIMKYEELKRWMERKIIEIVPLAYMRGRTLSKAFIILDEAQNTTFEQMKMFLTRLGLNSKAVITGDITQIDLPLTSITSGLVEIQDILKRISGIKFVYFSQIDVVRHSLVRKIIRAYEKRYRKKNNKISTSESSKKS